LVIGSTHEGEEQAMLTLLDRVRRAAKEDSRARRLAAVIAPLDVSRALLVVRLARAAGFSAHTPGAARDGDADVVVLDSVGLLARCYALGDAAFVGGSLLPTLKGHSVWEAVAQGKPVAYGPFMPRQGIYEELERDGVAVRGTVDVLGAAVLAWVQDEPRRRTIAARCAHVMAASVGATERVARLVGPLLA
jgi:3-deoxy-D-manno-octulosonic-acid transferase